MIFKINNKVLKDIEDKAEQFIVGLANEVKNEAKLVVPVRTGKLRDSIDVYPGDNKHERLVGSKVDYAIHVEMGTIKQRPKPFLRPALDNVVNSIK